MEEKKEVKNGVVDNIQISEDVVAVMAGIAIKDIEGVVKVAAGFVGEISEALGKKNLGKGIKVEIKEKEITVDAGIIIEYGIRIPEVAKKIQTKIRKDIEEMTGLKVISVNVRVQGIENYKIETTTESINEEK